MNILLNLFKNNQENIDNIISDELRSHKFEKKLALLVSQIEQINPEDLKYVNITKLDTSANGDLFNAYRLDFNTKDKLKIFKKKYKSLIL